MNIYTSYFFDKPCDKRAGTGVFDNCRNYNFFMLRPTNLQEKTDESYNYKYLEKPTTYNKKNTKKNLQPTIKKNGDL